MKLVKVSFKEQDQKTFSNVYDVRSSFFDGELTLDEKGCLKIEGNFMQDFSKFLKTLENEFFQFCERDANQINHNFDFYY